MLKKGSKEGEGERMIQRKRVIEIIVVISLLVLLVVVISIDNKNKTNDLVGTEAIKLDTSSSALAIKNIVEETVDDKTDLRVVTNTDIDTLEQSDIVLNSIGLDINNLTTFAVCADTRVESNFVIGIVKPKADKVEVSIEGLIDFIGSKQDVAVELGTNSKDYEIILNALVYKYEDYVIIVMAENQDTILDNIIYKINNIG